MKVLITGGTNGMGKGVALALAAVPGAELIILGRSRELGARVVEELGRLSSPERVSFVRCDLARLEDVRGAVEELSGRHTSLDALFVNAGLGYAPRREVTEDGLLEHFQVNYLSHFMLTLNLLELLEASPHGGRVIFNVTSFGALSFDDLQLEKRWTVNAAVGLGMVAKHMFLLRLHQLYAARGGAVSAVGFQIPRTVWSNQIAIIPPGMRAMATVARWFNQFITIEECGAIMAPLFTDGAPLTRARSGRFLTSRKGQLVDEARNPAPADPAAWERLWNVSLELCRDTATRRCSERLSGAPALLATR